MKIHNTETGAFVGTAQRGQTPEEIAEITGLPAASLRLEPEPHEIRDEVRQRIKATAGDQASLLGTTSDAAALAVFALASLVAKLSTAQSLAEVREAAAPFAELSADFLAKVESGETQLPFMAKGLDTVVEEIETRATAVSDALKAASED